VIFSKNGRNIPKKCPKALEDSEIFGRNCRNIPEKCPKALEIFGEIFSKNCRNIPEKCPKALEIQVGSHFSKALGHFLLQSVHMFDISFFLMYNYIHS